MNDCMWLRSVIEKESTFKEKMRDLKQCRSEIIGALYEQGLEEYTVPCYELGDYSEFEACIRCIETIVNERASLSVKLKVINDCLLELKPSIENKNIEVITNLDELNLVTSQSDLYKLIKNIVDNAIVYNNENGKLLIELKKNKLTISDTGVGISKEPYVVICATSVSSYFKGGNTKAVITNRIRATPHGTGFIKCASNYVISALAKKEAEDALYKHMCRTERRNSAIISTEKARFIPVDKLSAANVSCYMELQRAFKNMGYGNFPIE